VVRLVDNPNDASLRRILPRPRRRSYLLLASLACACVLLATSGASAQASGPVIISFWVTPRSLPSSGRVITITGRVHDAVSCTVYTDIGRPVTVPCRSGHFTLDRRLPADTGAYPDLYLPYVEVHAGRLNTRSRDAQVEVLLPSTTTPSQPPTTAAPPVVNLDGRLAPAARRVVVQQRGWRTDSIERGRRGQAGPAARSATDPPNYRS
jgi:hypothetical protein